MRYEKPFISLESLDDRLIEQGLSADRDDLMEEDLRRMGVYGWLRAAPNVEAVDSCDGAQE